MEKIHHWIDGKLTPGTSNRTGPVFNPATGEQIAEVDLASVEEVDKVVALAKETFQEWRTVPVARRIEILFRFRELVERYKEDIAKHLTRENGKVLSDSIGEVSRGLENIEYACGIGQLIKGEFVEQASSGLDVHSVKQPLGVVAGITPFNFPAMVPMWMFPTAIGCGNTFIVKPSEKDPSAPLFTMELLAKAGLPPGVVNLINGDKVAVDRLLEHPDVEAISFVGSTPIAKSIYNKASENGKRVQALGGAKNHMIVLPDADVDVVADAAISAAYGTCGERCMAISVVVAVGDIGDSLVDAISARLDKIKVGNGMDPDSEMGPLVTKEHKGKVAGYIESGVKEGATVVRDGRDDKFDGDGYFLGLTLLDNVTTDMTCYKEEIFGPVLSVVREESYEKAVALVDNNPFGNGTAIFTRDGGAARQFCYDVNCGMVGVNVPIPVPVSYFSFGGWKGSLFGDTHIYGPEGVHFYTQSKVVTTRWPDPSTSQIDLGFPQNR